MNDKIELHYKSTFFFSSFGIVDLEHLSCKEKMSSWTFLLNGMVGLWRTWFKKGLFFIHAYLFYNLSFIIFNTKLNTLILFVEYFERYFQASIMKLLVGIGCGFIMCNGTLPYVVDTISSCSV